MILIKITTRMKRKKSEWYADGWWTEDELMTVKEGMKTMIENSCVITTVDGG